ncbi:MAG TPA: hypothetical protein VIW69_04750 [Candidatus Elarobacter sp.]
MAVINEVALVFLLLVTALWSPAGGAAFRALSVLPLYRERLRPAYSFFLYEPLHAVGAITVVAYAVSGSGFLLGFLLYERFWGEPDRAYQLWTILLLACREILTVIEAMFLFRIDNVQRNLIQYKDAFGLRSVSTEDKLLVVSDPEAFRTFTRVNFFDVEIPRFARMLVSFGFVFYCVSALFPVTHLARLTIWKALQLAFSLTQVVDKPDGVPGDGVLMVVRSVCGLLAFIWIVLFVAVGSQLIDDRTAALSRDLKHDLGREREAAEPVAPPFDDVI